MLSGRASEQPSLSRGSGTRWSAASRTRKTASSGSWPGTRSELASTVEAVRIPVGALLRDLAAVPDQEAAGAGELVRLAREHPDGQLLVGEVGARQLERLRGLGLVLVDLAGVLVVTTGLELLDAVFVELLVGLAWGVVVSRHLVPRRHLSQAFVPGICRFCGWAAHVYHMRVDPRCRFVGGRGADAAADPPTDGGAENSPTCAGPQAGCGTRWQRAGRDGSRRFVQQSGAQSYQPSGAPSTTGRAGSSPRAAAARSSSRSTSAATNAGCVPAVAARASGSPSWRAVSTASVSRS